MILKIGNRKGCLLIHQLSGLVRVSRQSVVFWIWLRSILGPLGRGWYMRSHLPWY